MLFAALHESASGPSLLLMRCSQMSVHRGIPEVCNRASNRRDWPAPDSGRYSERLAARAARELHHPSGYI